jgi:hypothetical protein
MDDNKLAKRFCDRFLGLLALGVLSINTGCASGEQLQRIGVELGELAKLQLAQRDAQAEYLARAQKIEEQRQLGELDAAQAEQEHRRLELERFVAQDARMAAILERSANAAAATRDALVTPDGGQDWEDLARDLGIPGAMLLALNWWRNRTRKQALARPRSATSEVSA